jgi:hypothetical protein
MRTVLLTALLASTIFEAIPAFAQEREWTLQTNSDDEAYMTYGVPDTEDIGLSFWCKLGSKKVNLYIPRSGWKSGSAKQIDITVTAASTTIHTKAKLQNDGKPDNTSLEVMIETNNEIITALPEAQHLDIDTGKHKTIIPLYDAPVTNLLRLCNDG